MEPLFQQSNDYSSDHEGDGWVAQKSKLDDSFPGAVFGGAYHAYVSKAKAEGTLRFMDGTRPALAIRSVHVPPASLVAFGREGDVAFTKMQIQMQEGDRL